MPAYEHFAAFYDIVMDDPGPRAERVDTAIERFRPDAGSLLELGCGTGAILARLNTAAELTGLDLSPEMLAIAGRTVPGAHLILGDMSDFDLGRRFDVIICVFDSINLLMNVAAWASLMRCVHAHLADDGIFVLDVNTIGELRRLGDEFPWIYDFDGGTAIIDVTFAEDDHGVGVSDWNIRVFEQVNASRYELHHERIGEIALPLDRVRLLVADGFDLLEDVDEDGLPATDESVKAYFVLRRVN